MRLRGSAAWAAALVTATALALLLWFARVRLRPEPAAQGPPPLGPGGTVLIFIHGFASFNGFYGNMPVRDGWLERDPCAGLGLPFTARFVVDAADVPEGACHGVLYDPTYFEKPLSEVHRRPLLPLPLSGQPPRPKSVIKSGERPSFFPQERRFDVEWGLRPSANAFEPYGCPWYRDLDPQADSELALPDPATRAGVVVVVSQPYEPRRSLIAAIMARVKVDSHGRVFHNTDRAPDRTAKDWAQQKVRLLRQYRVTLAFESTSEPDYVTEKAYHALMADTVPVYWGAPNIADFLPPGSYIDATRYWPGNIDGLVAEIQRVQESDEVFLGYLRARSRPGRHLRLKDRCWQGICLPFAALYEERHLPPI